MVIVIEVTRWLPVDGMASLLGHNGLESYKERCERRKKKKRKTMLCVKRNRCTLHEISRGIYEGSQGCL